MTFAILLTNEEIIKNREIIYFKLKKELYNLLCQIIFYLRIFRNFFLLFAFAIRKFKI